MSQSYYEFYCPVKVIAGYKALEHIPFELQQLGVKRPMIVTDQGVRRNGLIEIVTAVFTDTTCEVGAIFDDVPPDSSLQTVRAAAHLFREQRCDALIAIGGGSVIDTTKGVNILVTEGGDDLLAYAGAHNLPRPLKPLFVIPTTSGTGSETTMVAVVTDTERATKIPFASHYLMPNAAILDPRMTQTLPPFITAMTAMDALTHAIESYTCLAANPLSDAYAFAAIRKIMTHLLPVLDQPDHVEGRLELAQASTMAGVAITNSMVGLVHSLGHAVGSIAHLPHGLCMSLFLPYVMQYNEDVNGEKMGELLLPLAGADVYATTPVAERAQKATAIVRRLRDELHQRTGLPRTLQETGKVTVDQLDAIAHKALDEGSNLFNPKETSFEDMRSILQQAWA